MGCFRLSVPFLPRKARRRTKTPAGSCRNFLENQGYCPWSGKTFRAKHPRPAAGCIVRPLPSAGARSRREHRAPRNASPATTHRKHAFFGQKRPTFCNLRLAKSHKKQFLLQNPTFWPRKGRKISFLLARRNSFCLHLQMKHHGDKAKQTRFTQPRRNLTSKRHCE